MFEKIIELFEFLSFILIHLYFKRISQNRTKYLKILIYEFVGSLNYVHFGMEIIFEDFGNESIFDDNTAVILL